MSGTPTTGGLIVKNAQYVEESTFGTFPTNPNMTWIAAIANLELKADVNTLRVPQIGTEDLKYLLKGMEVYSWDLNYAIQNSTFAKYAIMSQGGGAGTIDKSLSLVFSVKMSGVENYVQMSGARPGTLSITGKYGEIIQVRTTITGKVDPVAGTVNPVGSGTLATDPATNPWAFYDGGVNPITIGAVNPDVREFQVNFERNLEKLHVLGQSQMKFLPPKNRQITGTFTIVWEDENQYTNLTSATPVTITWVLKTAVSTLTLTGVELTQLSSRKYDPAEVVYDKYAFTALQASIT